MVKKTVDGFKRINLIVLVLIIVAVLFAGCAGNAPKAQLEITAKAATSLVITHKGGEKLVLKDMKITVTKEVNGKVVDGMNGVPMYGNNPEIQEQPAIEILESGNAIKHQWKESLLLGDILAVKIQDASGNIIYQDKIKVT
ncbi:MAG TPA: type IV pilin [Candidatus Methanoperedens sp.]